MKLYISLSAVPLSQVRSYMKSFNRTRYAQIFDKLGTGKKDKFRIYFPINSSQPNKVDLEVPTEIKEYLAKQNMTVSDYKLGLALMPDGKRKVSIGKILKDPKVKKIYDSDPQRKNLKSVPAWAVISRHPYDIVGMSFDRGWSSCMNLESGEYKEHLIDDVKQGTLVAYLLRNNDKNINNPIARIAIKPYLQGNNRILVPSKTYGTGTDNFSNVVSKFCSIRVPLVVLID